MSTYDIVIKGGTVVDGTGAPGRRADVGILGDRVVEVGDLTGATATRTIDAEGRLVTPGFVDIHSHLDAQVAWDAPCSSSCWHGVTSVVVGNCGVTFAPVKPTDHELLAKLMESVEDIPATSIMEGLDWNWHTTASTTTPWTPCPKASTWAAWSGIARCAFTPWASAPSTATTIPAWRSWR